jgi:A/G-specific adenine glycosylase
VPQVGDQPLPHGGEPARLAPALLRWHARHGRHDLPWQHDRTPYRVWVSEIMLQQTQVATVIGYYARFMARLPTLRSLAEAPEDEVLHLWSGLGYYSRARNLQRAARQAMAECGGELPASVAGLAGLPGIGPSTAAAIRALSAGERATILDGNVRRVLARYFSLAGPLGSRVATQRLWALAEACTPQDEVATYTQAIMDLGATVCLRTRPLCPACPLAADCAARRLGLQASIPAPKPRPARRTRATVLLLALASPGAVLLERQPARGVWAGLWCPLQFAGEAEALEWAKRYLAGARVAPGALAPFRHVFTHFDLEVTPLLVRCAGPAGVADSPGQAAAGNGMIWYSLAAPPEVGLPAPVSRLLAGLALATGADPDAGFLRG